MKDLDLIKEEIFQDWWGKGGQDIATKMYKEQVELNLSTNLNELVKEYYGENSISDETAETNVFWYEIEKLARENKIHLD